MAKKLGFGLMRLPQIGDSIDMEQTQKMVDAFLERGFTYFDTAWMYCKGKSEEAAKSLLVDRYPRDSFTLTTKLPGYMLKCKEDRDKVFNEQLRRTGAGFFDYYLLHDVNTNSLAKFEGFDCFDWLLEKKEQGLVKTIGFSYHDGPELLEQLLTKYPQVEVVQLQLNYLDWESKGVRSRACHEVASRFGKKIIVMEPVKGGMLANVPASVAQLFKTCDSTMSVPSWAIRFAASQDNVMMVLSGMSNMEQVLDNTGYMAEFTPLTDAEKELTQQAAQILNSTIAIACTGCAYCTVECPQDIPIPNFFALYNTDALERSMCERTWTSQGGYYSVYAANHNKASACIGCGKCEKMCPQHLPIREHLKQVAAHFER